MPFRNRNYKRISNQTPIKLNDRVIFYDGVHHHEGQITGTMWWNGRTRLLLAYKLGGKELNIPLAPPYFVTHKEAEST